jgi:hypothetical protein
MHDVHIKEAEQSALAEQALAQFEARETGQLGGGLETIPAVPVARPDEVKSRS